MILLNKSCTDHANLASQTSTGIWEIPSRGRECSKTNFFWTSYSSNSYHVFNAPDKEQVSQADFTQTFLAGKCYSAEKRFPRCATKYCTIMLTEW